MAELPQSPLHCSHALIPQTAQSVLRQLVAHTACGVCPPGLGQAHLVHPAPGRQQQIHTIHVPFLDGDSKRSPSVVAERFHLQGAVGEQQVLDHPVDSELHGSTERGAVVRGLVHVDSSLIQQIGGLLVSDPLSFAEVDEIIHAVVKSRLVAAVSVAEVDVAASGEQDDEGLHIMVMGRHHDGCPRVPGAVRVGTVRQQELQDLQPRRAQVAKQRCGQGGCLR